MKMHERTGIVDAAEVAIRDAVFKIIAESDLTETEEMMVLLSVYHSLIGGTLKYMLRYERHGNYTTQADEATEDGE